MLAPSKCSNEDYAFYNKSISQWSIGSLIIRPYGLKDIKGASIWAVRIDPVYRGLGLGFQMMTDAVDLAREQKLKELILYVFEDNKVAWSLYDKVGFAAIRPDDNGFGKVLMVMEL